MNRLTKWLACLLLLGPAAVCAQVIPLQVEVVDNSAVIRVGSDAAPWMDVRLDFDDASGLTPASIGHGAKQISVSSPSILARLPSTQVTIPSTLPVMLTIEPPLLGGLAFDRRVHVEVHTHLLTYTVGSRYRLFKSPLGGAFRDVTSTVQPGSVRTRGTTGGFSQFLVVYDQRPTNTVVAEKIQWLRDQVALLSPSEAAPLYSRLDSIEAAVAAKNWSAAIKYLENARVRVANRAGVAIPETWSADQSTTNHAGELLSGLDTLQFSIEYLRDFGP